MRGVFDYAEREPIQPSRDTELTLSSGTLLAMFFGLVMICGLCFGVGYAVGRHGSQVVAAPAQQPTAAAQSSLPAASTHAKPSAIAQFFSATSTNSSSGADQAPTAASDRAAVANPPAPFSGGSTSPSSGQPQVHPALSAAANSHQVGQSAAGPSVHPALAQAVQLMVQIAAVANPEDGEVLVNALRRRGYAVVARHDPEDNLIHVRIGPFNSREDANHWRQKLLNDGYNAMVMP